MVGRPWGAPEGGAACSSGGRKMRERGSVGTGSRVQGGGPPRRARTHTGQEDGQQQPQQQEQQAGQQEDAEPGERAVWLQLCGTPAWGQVGELLRARCPQASLPVPSTPSPPPPPVVTMPGASGAAAGVLPEGWRGARRPRLRLESRVAEFSLEGRDWGHCGRGPLGTAHRGRPPGLGAGFCGA